MVMQRYTDTYNQSFGLSLFLSPRPLQSGLGILMSCSGADSEFQLETKERIDDIKNQAHINFFNFFLVS